MSLLRELIVGSIFAVILMGLLISIPIHKHIRRKHEKEIKTPIVRYGFSIITFGLAAFMLSQSFIGIYQATKHGAYDYSYMQLSYSDLMDKVDKSYVEDTNIPPDDELPGCILIFVRFGCPDCEGIHDALVEKNIIGNTEDNVYILSSRSVRGKEILEHFDIQLMEVPGGVYIKKNTTNMTYSQWILYEKDENGNSVFNEEAYKHLIQCQVESR